MSAYFIFNHKVLDSDTLNNEYLPKAIETLKPCDPEILVVDQHGEVLESGTDETRMVVLKFKDRDQAKHWYNSAEYQAIVNLRTDSVDGRAILCDAFDPASV